MREIKFRAKTFNNGWRIGFVGYTKDPNFKQLFWTEYVDKEPFTKKDYLDENTVGQFTGLNDKNGKDIYEGDILRASDPKDPLTFSVKWYDYGGTNLLGINTCAFEVIGNIHENPELIKE